MNLQFEKRWAELWALVLIVIGFLFSIQIGNVIVVYTVAAVFGAIFGRLLWKFRKGLKGGILTIILGFVVGFLLGAQAGDRKVLILLFVLGLVVSFYAHEQNILRSADY